MKKKLIIILCSLLLISVSISVIVYCKKGNSSVPTKSENPKQILLEKIKKILSKLTIAMEKKDVESCYKYINSLRELKLSEVDLKILQTLTEDDLFSKKGLDELEEQVSSWAIKGTYITAPVWILSDTARTCDIEGYEEENTITYTCYYNKESEAQAGVNKYEKYLETFKSVYITKSEHGQFNFAYNNGKKGYMKTRSIKVREKNSLKKKDLFWVSSLVVEK